jgi:hypothetical protein
MFVYLNGFLPFSEFFNTAEKATASHSSSSFGRDAAIGSIARVGLSFAMLGLITLDACGHDARFKENFTGGTPTPASLEISRTEATPLPSVDGNARGGARRS